MTFALKFAQWQVSIDEARLRRRIETATEKALGRIGAVLRQEARKTIRRRVVTDAMRERLANAKTPAAKRRILETISRRQGTVSAAGEPPIAHVPDHPVASIRAIYFAVQGKEVIVGPVQGNAVGSGTVPEILERGGISTLQEERLAYLGGQPGPWVRRNVRRPARSWKRYRSRSASYAPRPFMRPTLERNQETIRKLLFGAFRGGL